MNYVNAILNFLRDVAIATIGHLFWLLGAIFVFGLLLYLCARLTRNTFAKTVGEKLDVYITGWIGTPIHELGHALFCILFRHKITEMQLYNPNPNDGTLGYVAHTWNANSRYQKIGNFFIGIGPILFGAVVLYALMYFLMPEMASQFLNAEQQGADLAQDIGFENWRNFWNIFSMTIGGILSEFINGKNYISWQFWVFLYLSFCIASHMELSPPDIMGALSGLITFAITVLAFNFVILGIERLGFESFAGGYWQYVKLETYALYINQWLGILGALFTYALIISGLCFALSYIVLNSCHFKKYRRIINPFG